MSEKETKRTIWEKIFRRDKESADHVFDGVASGSVDADPDDVNWLIALYNKLYGSTNDEE